MNYVYTVRGKVCHIEPYTPFYQVCTFLGFNTGYYFVRDPLPQIEPDREYYLTYHLREGYQVHYEPLSEEDIALIDIARQKLTIHKRYLNVVNSLKLRYIKTGYGQDVLDRLLQEELTSTEPPVLFQQLADSKGTSVEQEKETYKLYLQDLRFMFQFLISLEQRMLALIEEGKYNEAYDVVQEARTNMWNN